MPQRRAETRANERGERATTFSVRNYCGINIRHGDGASVDAYWVHVVDLHLQSEPMNGDGADLVRVSSRGAFTSAMTLLLSVAHTYALTYARGEWYSF